MTWTCERSWNSKNLSTFYLKQRFVQEYVPLQRKWDILPTRFLKNILKFWTFLGGNKNCWNLPGQHFSQMLLHQPMTLFHWLMLVKPICRKPQLSKGILMRSSSRSKSPQANSWLCKLKHLVILVGKIDNSFGANSPPKTTNWSSNHHIFTTTAAPQ